MMNINLPAYNRTHVCQLDDFSAAEAEFLVVIQNGVHVLDPDGVHGSIKHVPALVVIRRRRPNPDQRRQDPVRPAQSIHGRN